MPAVMEEQESLTTEYDDDSEFSEFEKLKRELEQKEIRKWDVVRRQIVGAFDDLKRAGLLTEKRVEELTAEAGNRFPQSAYNTETKAIGQMPKLINRARLLLTRKLLVDMWYQLPDEQKRCRMFVFTDEG